MKKIILSDPKNFSFSSASRLFNFRTAIVLGACRSGKTSLGTLIGSCQFVDNIEEPWTAKIITLLSGLGMVPENLCKQILLNFITESYNETVLFRTVSRLFVISDTLPSNGSLAPFLTTSKVSQYFSDLQLFCLSDTVKIVPGSSFLMPS